MSLDAPNEYEQAIEDYAEIARRVKSAKENLRAAAKEEAAAKKALQEAWSGLRVHIRAGKLKPGIYRLNRGDGYADGILITDDNELSFPIIHPMFR